MFWLSIRFFFPLFCALRFVLGEKSSVGLLSLFFPFGEIGKHIIRLSLSLSLTKSARFGKPDLPLECSAGHKKREGGSSLRKKRSTPPIHSRAKAGKKKMDWISRLIAAREPQPQEESRRVKDENAYIREQICARCVLPCVRPRGACLQNSFSPLL